MKRPLDLLFAAAVVLAGFSLSLAAASLASAKQHKKNSPTAEHRRTAEAGRF